MCSGEYFILMARPFLFFCLYWGQGFWRSTFPFTVQVVGFGRTFYIKSPLYQMNYIVQKTEVVNSEKMISQYNLFMFIVTSLHFKRSKKKAISLLKEQRAKQFQISILESARGTEINETANSVLIDQMVIKEYSHFRLGNINLRHNSNSHNVEPKVSFFI